jgi:hypothetical protein
MMAVHHEPLGVGHAETCRLLRRMANRVEPVAREEIEAKVDRPRGERRYVAPAAGGVREGVVWGKTTRNKPLTFLRAPA